MFSKNKTEMPREHLIIKSEYSNVQYDIEVARKHKPALRPDWTETLSASAWNTTSREECIYVINKSAAISYSGGRSFDFRAHASK